VITNKVLRITATLFALRSNELLGAPLVDAPFAQRQPRLQCLMNSSKPLIVSDATFVFQRSEYPMFVAERQGTRAVAAEVGEQRGVAVQPEVLTNEFDSQHFTVTKHGARPTLVQAKWSLAQGIVNVAEDGYNQRVQVHGAPPKRIVQRLPFKGTRAWTSTCQTTKTCTSRHLM